MSVVQMPERPCPFCHKNEATQLCDFVVDYVWTTMKDERGHMIGPMHLTCDNDMCKECATNIAGHEFCPSCAKLYEYVQHHHEIRRTRR